jgi:hypothetical protein
LQRSADGFFAVVPRLVNGYIDLTWEADLGGRAPVDRFSQLRIRSTPPEEAPSLYSRQAFEPRPGRSLVVSFCGTVTRGGPRDNPVLHFSTTVRPTHRAAAGPGWTPGQHQGRFMNTAIPVVETAGERNYAEKNDNVDTLFITVLREEGAFYLISGEPAARPP